MHQASISDTTDRIHSWSPCGDVLTLITNRDGPMEVHINQMEPAVDELFCQLAAKLSSLFPSEMELPPEPKWNLKDNIGANKSFVDQSDFSAIMVPLYTKFKALMQSPKEASHQKSPNSTFQLDSSWLESEQEVLEKIFLILLLTGGGIPPRTFSIAALQYRKTTSEKRNLYFLNDTLCFIWPKAKCNSLAKGSSSESLFAYPPRLNWFIFIYLGIIRKFTIETMKEQNLFLGEMDNKLFVYTTKSKRGSSWDAHTMNSVLGNLTEHIFNSKSTVPDMRQLMQAIYSQYFEMGRKGTGIMEATANRMGNHSLTVAVNWYGRTTSKENDWIQPCIACSKAWHCWLGLIPYDPIISSHFGSLPFLQRRENKLVANDTASHWINGKDLRVLEKLGLKELISKLLSKVRLSKYLLLSEDLMLSY